ncbi:MAG: M12 family metallo-peptidase [Chitinophagales bacterium]
MMVAGGATKHTALQACQNPLGDPFDIDYLAHEIGHQFGGSHTFNGETGSCGGGNRSQNSAYEVG